VKQEKQVSGETGVQLLTRQNAPRQGETSPAVFYAGFIALKLLSLKPSLFK